MRAAKKTDGTSTKLLPLSNKEESKRRKNANRALIKVLREQDIHLDNPRVLPIRGKTFAFTGKFDFGTQSECMRGTRKHGGYISPSNHVTNNIDVLVVGNSGSANWFWEEYGRKMKEADELRQTTQKLLIVSEYRWRKEID